MSFLKKVKHHPLPPILNSLTLIRMLSHLLVSMAGKRMVPETNLDLALPMLIHPINDPWRRKWNVARKFIRFRAKAIAATPASGNAESPVIPPNQKSAEISHVGGLTGRGALVLLAALTTKTRAHERKRKPTSRPFQANVQRPSQEGNRSCDPQSRGLASRSLLHRAARAAGAPAHSHRRATPADTFRGHAAPRSWHSRSPGADDSSGHLHRPDRSRRADDPTQNSGCHAHASQGHRAASAADFSAWRVFTIASPHPDGGGR